MEVILLKINKKSSKNLVKGFTLIELMVSLTIFSIVMVAGIGTLLILIDSNAKAQALYSSSINLSFALDSMTRELRTGYNYYCDTLTHEALPDINVKKVNDCTSGKFIAVTKESDGGRIGYQLNHNSDNTQKWIEKKIDNGPWSRMTSEDLVIDKFEMNVKNTPPGVTGQPYIDLVIKGYVNNGLDIKTDFSIQSHIVQRRLDTN